MNRKYGVAGQRKKEKKDAETERKRNTGVHPAAVEEGKFHVSV